MDIFVLIFAGCKIIEPIKGKVNFSNKWYVFHFLLEGRNKDILIGTEIKRFIDVYGNVFVYDNIDWFVRYDRLKGMVSTFDYIFTFRENAL